MPWTSVYRNQVGNPVNGGYIRIEGPVEDDRLRVRVGNSGSGQTVLLRREDVKALADSLNRYLEGRE